MRCTKCGLPNPDDARFCENCGHKLQSDRHAGPPPPGPEDTPGQDARRLLDFQGWARSGRGSGSYVEACVYAVILVAGVVWCLADGVTWPLYPLIAILALAAWLRRL
jgi:hypothetical protein